MANFFDQFDQQPVPAPDASVGNGNFFDQFDVQPTEPANQPEPAPKDFFQRLQDDFDKRRAAINRAEDRMMLWQPYTDVAKPGEYRGQGLNPISGRLQQLGQYAGGGFDILGEGALSLYNAIPESVKDNAVTRTVGEAYKSKFLPGEISPADVVNTVGQTVGAGYEAARQYAPDTVANLEAIAAIAPVTQAAGRGVGAVGTLGKAIESSGVRAASEKTLGLAKDIVSPKETAKTKAGQIRVEKGWNRKQEVVDSRLDEIARDVAPIIDSKKSLLGNENAIRKANVLEAENLKSSLEKLDVTIGDDTILQTLSGVKQELDAYPWLQGNGKKTAENIINQATDIVAANPRTPAGILEARKTFDKLVESQKPGAFDAVRDEPLTVATRKVREAMNKMVADAVPDEGVRESLRRQNNMFIALDNIATKRAALPDTRVGRAFKSAQDVVSLKGAILGTAAAGGIGLGAAPVILPAAGLYGAYRLAASPTTRKLVGQALQAPEKVLQAPSKLKQRLTKQDLQAAFEAKKGTNTPEQMLALPAPQTTVFVDKNGVGVPLTQADREIIGQMPSEFLNPAIEQVSKLPPNEAKDLLDRYLRSVAKGKSPR
jgi:hypothetical protein